MTLAERARQLRAYIEKASASLGDADALNAVELYPAWSATATYTAGDRVRYNETLYKCLQDHAAQSDWTPVDAPSLWARVLIVDPDTVSEWQQPDSTNAYSAGDKVTHNGKTWTSETDNNVWESGVYGWAEVKETT